MDKPDAKQSCKVFCGGLSWETSSERLRAYFENFGVVREAFVSYNRNNGRPRGFGFVVFESAEVADKVVASKHTIDRREVECKKAVPKEEQPPGSISSPPSSTADGAGPVRTKKVFVGGLAPGVDEKVLRQHFEQFGTVDDAVVMYDHDNKRPRGFGFVTFTSEDSVDKVFGKGSMQTILDKQIEIKPAVPRDQMPATSVPPPGGRMQYWGDGRNAAYAPPQGRGGGGGFGGGGGGGFAMPPPSYGSGFGPRGFGPRGPAGYGNYGPGAHMGHMGGQQQRGMGRGQGQFMQGMQGQGGGMQGGYPRGGYNNAGFAGGKMQGGYDMYGANGSANGMFGSNAQALYNLANFQPHINGMQAPSGGSSKQQPLTNFTANQISTNLKALGALASTLGAFPQHNQSDAAYQDDPSNYTGQEADYAAAEAAAAAAAAAAAGSLAVQQDFSSFAHEQGGFTTSPAPGWSS